ncbi:MAG: hypothetical protein BGO39_20115 [Chloroflexi bacterium 54-19]|nr:MAG: hypothetical protein BGO39_20115 [Chloroflexi bacterium 54-19]
MTWQYLNKTKTLIYCISCVSLEKESTLKVDMLNLNTTFALGLKKPGCRRKTSTKGVFQAKVVLKDELNLKLNRTDKVSRMFCWLGKLFFYTKMREFRNNYTEPEYYVNNPIVRDSRQRSVGRNQRAVDRNQ